MEDILETQDTQILPGLAESDVPEVAARIMSVALRLFARKGYAATSVREIVQEADVTNPMLYYYFKSKAGLFEQLVDYLFGSLETDVREALAEGRGLRDKLLRLTWLQLEACREAPVALQFVYALIFAPKDSRPDFNIFAQHVPVIAQITEIFRDAIEAGQFIPNAGFCPLFLTHQYFGLLNGHLMRALTIVESVRPAAKRREYLDEMLTAEQGTQLIEFFMAGAGRMATQEK